jgi:CBS domain-containing protein
MTPNVITATSNQTIREVCKIMSNHKIGSLVILNDTKPVSDKNAQYSNPIGIETE